MDTTRLRLPDEMPALRVVPMPRDANVYGDVFGGWIMAEVDIAGGFAARRVAKGRVATVAVTSFVFKEPLTVGDLVSFYARIIRVGTTSITVEVEVFAERHVTDLVEVVRVTEAQLVYVAVDEAGHKRSLPPGAARAAGSGAATGATGSDCRPLP
jgi:acyl-CoA thioesterase YciA